MNLTLKKLLTSSLIQKGLHTKLNTYSKCRQSYFSFAAVLFSQSAAKRSDWPGRVSLGTHVSHQMHQICNVRVNLVFAINIALLCLKWL